MDDDEDEGPAATDPPTLWQFGDFVPPPRAVAISPSTEGDPAGCACGGTVGAGGSFRRT